MAIESVPDPLDLIQGNFPADDEVKFAVSASGLTSKVAYHTDKASEYRATINSLPEEAFAGLTADKSREELTKLEKRHEEESQFNQKFAETMGSLGEQILSTKNMINGEVTSATLKIQQLEAIKAGSTTAADRQKAQDLIDSTTKAAREDIKALNDMLERSMTQAESSIGVLHEQMEAAAAEIAPGSGGAAEGAGSSDEAFAPLSAPVSDAAFESYGEPGGSPLPGMPGGSGAEQVSASSPEAAMTPASMMSGMPQMPQAAAPSGGGMPGGGGSQLPGQELASKAMDMAQNAGGPDTYLSDDAVKDLLDASADGGGLNGSGDGGLGGAGETQNDSAGSQHGSGPGTATGGGVGGVGPSNPSAASSPSPATPVSTPRPVGGPSLAVTELASGAPSAAPTAPTGSGLSAASSGIGSLTAGTASSVAAATAPAVNAAVPQAGFTPGLTPMPTAGTVAMPSTPAAAPPAAPPPASPGSPSATTPPATATPPASPSAPPAAATPAAKISPPDPAAPASATTLSSSSSTVAAPPVTPGVAALPPSMRTAPSPVLDSIAPAAPVQVPAAAPERLEDLPAQQRITILNTASIVTQMRQMGMPPSIATALIYDGTTVAVAIATADDISILPPDIVIPQSSILLNRFHLGEDFRTQWAGCADTVTKLLAAVDVHPQLDRSMILHTCAFTTKSEMQAPAVGFTPMSMDAAWAIRYFYSPPPLTAPAYTLREETFTPQQIEYLLRTAETTWQLPTKRLHREGQARLESASMFASRWSTTGEVGLSESPRGYDSRIAGHLYAATREALIGGDLERASWYAQYLRYQTLPSARPAADAA